LRQTVGCAASTTLATYLEQAQRHAQTCSTLHIHPNTLYQRLAPITELLGPSWKDPGRTLEVHLALRLHRPLDAVGDSPSDRGDPVVTFRTTDDVTLAYTDDGTGRPIVLIHGYTAPAAAWAFTIDALLENGYRAITLDRRSHGLSETPAYGQRMARHGRDIGEFLEHLGLADATLVGASMGGNAIWAYVDQYGSDRVRAVVIVDQTPKMLNSADWPYGFYGYDADNAGTLFAAGVPETGRGRTVDKSTPQLIRLVERLGGPPAFRDGTAAETLGLLSDHAVQDWRDVVARIPRPVLMMAARESQVWPYEHAAAAVADNPYGRAVIVEDSGHAISLDQPDAFNAILLDFLHETETSSTRESRF
jgi:non-heme chloroperoxidase